ncbi:hypothetical protein D3H55_01900 [Bacillus salacetis]|uniref:Uncharacterized protein n=1 Tax=Bacillus salacetis TaxID=2315464 RepID=A0A3A1R587_9BACI|nr:hypothetical protein [Bacillus salacetis]RIW38319.1 hypothetical protein D3H55_01900 [Bacillus salacetis]
MQKIKDYIVTDEVLQKWKEKFVPSYDLLFFESCPDFLDCRVLSSDTFPFFSLDEKTSFTTWGVRKEAGYYSRFSNDAYETLTDEQKKEIIKEQWRLERGLLFSEEELLSLVGNEGEIQVLKPSSYYDEAKKTTVYMLQRFLWDSLSNESQTTLLLNYASLWTGEQAVLACMEEGLRRELLREYSFLARYFDTYSHSNGPNCLAAAAAGFTRDCTLLDEWMHPDRFFVLLEQNGYHQIESGSQGGRDVLVWKDSKGQASHAAFLLNDQYCFNKHGQTMFNPWQVLPVQDVIESWSQDMFELHLFRKF